MINHGFIEPKLDREAYILGSSSLPKIVIQPDGQWDKFLPAYEAQSNVLFDTQNCTGFGTTSAVEILFLVKYYE